jgi:hypothetical protein
LIVPLLSPVATDLTPAFVIVKELAAAVRVIPFPCLISRVLADEPSYVYKSVPSVVPVLTFKISLLETFADSLA